MLQIASDEEGAKYERAIILQLLGLAVNGRDSEVIFWIVYASLDFIIISLWNSIGYGYAWVARKVFVCWN